MVHDESSKVLRRLEPPQGGWERLQRERTQRRVQRATGFALFGGAVSAGLCVFMLDVATRSATPLELPPTAARLVDLPLGTESVRIDAMRVRSLPSAEAGVLIYWAEPER